jgi:acyl-CoA reductase-like NAD-dependent aldehyde dehydrogenase
MSNPFLNYIAGQWVECQSRKTFPDINPANTTEIIGHFQASGAEDVQTACDAAAKGTRTATMNVNDGTATARKPSRCQERAPYRLQSHPIL